MKQFLYDLIAYLKEDDNAWEICQGLMILAIVASVDINMEGSSNQTSNPILSFRFPFVPGLESLD